MTKSPIFIIGTPRSGTTLCGNIIGRHSKVFVPGETHFFDDIYTHRNQLGSPSNSATSKIIIEKLLNIYEKYNEPEDQRRIDTLIKVKNLREKLAKQCHSYEDYLSCFMSEQTKFEGKLRWANHTPKDIFNIEDILSFYPDAKIIVCVRDIRDFLVSYKNKWRVTRPESVDILKSLYHPITTSLQWKASMKSIPFINNLLSTNGYFLLKYEDLVNTPDISIPNLCTYIGEEFEPQMLDIQINNSSAGSTQKGIFTTSIGRWNKELTKEELFIAQVISRTEMHTLGYTIESVHPNIVKLTLSLMGFPMALIKAIKANRELRGPLLTYLLRRGLRLFSRSNTP